MNVFFKMLLCTMLLATFVACNDDDDVKDAILEVNYKNLNGTWRLSEWNGKEMIGMERNGMDFNGREWN